ncbi:MAG: HAD family hydrolase [Dehalococcoidales bacterium]|nr:MAG: HAD family hydrolase [Dehalococcoidales bacterium]
MEFRVASIDMFGTLVDIGSIRHAVWRTFLKDRYTAELADEYWNRVGDLLFQLIDDQIIEERPYVPLKVIFETMYSRFFPEISLDFDPKEAAVVLAHQHPFSTLYDDTVPFLESVSKEYPICLASDTDDDMLGPLRQLYPFDRVITSEQIESYKASADKRFFSEIIDQYGVKPENIIHIGDSSYDIIGAGEVGIVTCWLNRNDRTWSHDTKPDYEVNSLIDAASILGIDIDSSEFTP